MQRFISTQDTLQVMLIGPSRNVCGEKYDRTQRSPKMPSKQPKSKVIIHVIGRFRGTSAGDHGISIMNMGGQFKNSHRLEWHITTFSGLQRKSINGVFRSILIQ